MSRLSVLRDMVQFTQALTPSHDVAGSLRGTSHHEAAMTNLKKRSALLLKAEQDDELPGNLEQFLGEAKTAYVLGGIGVSDLETIEAYAEKLRETM